MQVHKMEFCNIRSRTQRETILRVESTGVDVLDAALVAKEALRVGQGKVRRAMKCIEAGEMELRRQEKTVTFAYAVEAALEARKKSDANER